MVDLHIALFKPILNVHEMVELNVDIFYLTTCKRRCGPLICVWDRDGRVHGNIEEIESILDLFGRDRLGQKLDCNSVLG